MDSSIVINNKISTIVGTYFISHVSSTQLQKTQHNTSDFLEFVGLSLEMVLNYCQLNYSYLIHIIVCYLTERVPRHKCKKEYNFIDTTNSKETDVCLICFLNEQREIRAGIKPKTCCQHFICKEEIVHLYNANEVCVCMQPALYTVAMNTQD